MNSRFRRSSDRIRIVIVNKHTHRTCRIHISICFNLQPVYQEPFQIRGLTASKLDCKLETKEAKSSVEATTNVTSSEHGDAVHNSLDNLKEPATLQLVRKGKLTSISISQGRGTPLFGGGCRGAGGGVEG